VIAVPPGSTVLGVGVDAVDLTRFRTTITRTPSIVARMFTAGERAYAEKARDPTERLAARFAAKEAVMKSMGVGLGAFELQECEVVRADSGEPSVLLHGGAAAVAAEHGVARFLLTMTHTETTAIAFVVALG